MKGLWGKGLKMTRGLLIEKHFQMAEGPAGTREPFTGPGDEVESIR